MSLPRWNRKLHRLGALLTFAPVLVIFSTGVLLQLKQDWSWVQPPTQRGVGTVPEIAFEEVLGAARGVPEAEIDSWADVDRLDVRPELGVVKVRSRNRFEVQVDTSTAQVLQVAYRRSDLIEELHDGSWLHPRVKLLAWLPTAFVLCGLWATGVYLWLLPHRVRWRRRRHGRAQADARAVG